MSSAFRVREWSGYALHSYYGGLILDTGLGAVLHVGVLVSVCRLRLRLGWLTQYVETTAAKASWKLEIMIYPDFEKDARSS